MSFNPRNIEAKISLGMISSVDMPSVAWDTLEADLDGPAIRRMAAFDRPTSFEVEAVMPRFMKEAGLRLLGEAQAYLRLAYDKARTFSMSRKIRSRSSHFSTWQA